MASFLKKITDKNFKPGEENDRFRVYSKQFNELIDDLYTRFESIASDISSIINGYLPLAGGTMDTDATISFNNGSSIQSNDSEDGNLVVRLAEDRMAFKGLPGTQEQMYISNEGQLGFLSDDVGEPGQFGGVLEFSNITKNNTWYLPDAEGTISLNTNVDLLDYSILFMDETFTGNNLKFNSPNQDGSPGSSYKHWSVPIYKIRYVEGAYEADQDLGGGDISTPRAAFDGTWVTLSDGGFDAWEDSNYKIRKRNKVTIEDFGTFVVGEVDYSIPTAIKFKLDGTQPANFTGKKFKRFDVVLTDLVTILQRESGGLGWAIVGGPTFPDNQTYYDNATSTWDEIQTSYTLDISVEQYVCVPTSFTLAAQKGTTNYDAMPILGYEANEKAVWQFQDGGISCYRVKR